MKIMVVDAQGGGLGKQIVAAIKKYHADWELFAIGTNMNATAAMLKAGADHGATGENPVVVVSRDVDYIIGPVGIVIADSMYGEITPKMAQAISQSRAKRILLPVNHCDNIVVGVEDLSIGKLVEGVIEMLKKQCKDL